MTEDEVQQLEQAYQKKSEDSLVTFVRGLTIPSATGRKMFDVVMADFQRRFFEEIAPSLHAVRDGTMPPCKRFWLERTKKTGKDADVACCLVWLMAFSERPILGQVCAANSKQAAIIEDRARAILHYNPWLDDHVEIIERVIRSKKLPEICKVQIEATGSAGAAQGPTPDVLVLNELVHVDRWEVMKAHMNNATGVPQGIVIVATNAGIKGTPAEVWRLNALNPHQRAWKCFIWQKKAPWLSDEDMQEARRMDPIGAEFARLWEGRWISGVGSAVDQDSIDRCFRLEGPSRPEQGWRYVAGLDLGISHDHSGLVVLGVNEKEGRIKEAWMRGYEPSVPNDKGVLEVDCDRIEEDACNLWKQYRIEHFGYDPAAGGSFMAQRLRKRGVPMREMTFASAANQTLMAKAFVTAMKDGKLECFDDEEGRMRRDFGKFNVEHKPPSKYKLTAVSDEHGHADVGVSLVICLPRAVEMLSGSRGLLPDDDIAVTGDEQLTDEEVESMPAELREIYDMELEAEQAWSKRSRPKISDLQW